MIITIIMISFIMADKGTPTLKRIPWQGRRRLHARCSTSLSCSLSSSTHEASVSSQTSIQKQTNGPHMYVCVYIYIYIYTHTYTYIHTGMHAYIYTYMHACIHTHPWGGCLDREGDFYIWAGHGDPFSFLLFFFSFSSLCFQTFFAVNLAVVNRHWQHQKSYKSFLQGTCGPPGHVRGSVLRLQRCFLTRDFSSGSGSHCLPLI